jgi:hypothetical protein
MKLLLIALLFAVSTACLGKTFIDRPLEFSLNMPDATKVDVAENDQGRSVNLIYQGSETDNNFAVSAVRANNGGFNESLDTVFAQMMNGVSKNVGKKPSVPLRTLPYRGYELHVAQHIGADAQAAQTLTTVVFFQERVGWRKVITLQFITRGTDAPSNEFIIEKLNGLQYMPVVQL